MSTHRLMNAESGDMIPSSPGDIIRGNPGRGMGRLVAIDERDRGYLMARYTPEPTRKSRSWRIPSPLDQGWVPACVGFGFKHFLLAEPMRRAIGRTPSAVELYTAAQRHDEWEGEGYDGTSVRGGAKALEKLGLIREYVWGYSADDVRRFILTRGTVVVGVEWYRGMTQPVRNIMHPTGPAEGGHCVLVYRYDNRRQRFGILNSWGPGWGDRGKAWLGEADLDALLKAGGEACSAIECLPKVNV